MRHTPLSRGCPPTTKLSRQKYNWAYEETPHEQQPPNTMTGPFLTTDIRDKYVLALRNKFDALQETEIHTPNDEYVNFVNAHFEAAAKCIPTKLRTKSRVPLAVREKCADVKIASKCNWKNPMNTNALKLKMAWNELASIYLKEQTEYIQNQIDKIRDSVEDRQSRIVWQMINKVSRRKSTAKAQLKTKKQQERIKLWKQHFENLVGNPPKVTHEPIIKLLVSN